MRNKKIVRLTEGQLHGIIAESVERILKEFDYDNPQPSKRKGWGVRRKERPEHFVGDNYWDEPREFDPNAKMKVRYNESLEEGFFGLFGGKKKKQAPQQQTAPQQGRAPLEQKKLWEMGEFYVGTLESVTKYFGCNFGYSASKFKPTQKVYVKTVESPRHLPEAFGQYESCNFGTPHPILSGRDKFGDLVYVYTFQDLNAWYDKNRWNYQDIDDAYERNQEAQWERERVKREAENYNWRNNPNDGRHFTPDYAG